MLATVLGLILTIWVFRSVGFDGVLAAARRIGCAGFALYCLYSLGVFVILGGAWLASAPGEPLSRLLTFAWARLVREAVSDLLPFAQLGGLVIGARVMIGARMPPARVYASMVVDLTTEMASQLAFTVWGLAAMATILLAPGGAAVRPLIVGGTLSMGATMIAFLIGQRWVLALARRLTRGLLPSVSTLVGAVEAELGRIYANRRRIVLATLINLAGWVGSASGAWLVLRLMGQPIGIGAALSIESLIFVVRSVAFAIPGALGVQEAAYALIAPLFGLAPDVALALSLAKRAREVAIGLPALLVWQVREARALFVPAIDDSGVA